MKETFVAIASTLAFLLAMGQIDPNMTIGEFVDIYYPMSILTVDSDEEGSSLEETEPEEELPVIIIEDEPVLPTLTVYTEKDARLMAEIMHAEANGLSDAQKRAVGWCILNRVDEWDGTIQSIATQEGAFVRSSYCTAEEIALANEVLLNWANGGPRELPPDYLYFNGNGEENLFRKELLSSERFSVPEEVI